MDFSGQKGPCCWNAAERASFIYARGAAMSEFRLGLPTDIPWKRICVSEDMLDPVPCDAERPDRWRSSLAVFRYDPLEDYQPYDDCLISYLKVVVTVSPYVPEISKERATSYVPPVLVEDLEEAFPCYGALLQVTVAPPEELREEFDKKDFPYFIDFEPKKRELYEAVTDTGEVLSGSSTSLTVGKSAQQSDTTENYNIDTGWNFGLNASYAGTGGGFSVGESGQVGTVGRTGLQNTNIRTAEESTERRERQSHTTQLSQMYNLFQAFHLGTNRALFFMEPRPHIRQSEATFINGPRALEGLQEIFLIVARPRKMVDFCPSVLLETAHLTKTPVYEYDTRTHVINYRLLARAQNKDTTSGETDWTEAVSKTEDYAVPSGWEVDTSRGSGGYSVRILREARRRRGPTVTVTSTKVSVFGEVTWRFWETGLFNDDHYADGYLDADVTVYLRKTEPDLKEMTERLFLSAVGSLLLPATGGRRRSALDHVGRNDPAGHDLQRVRGPRPIEGEPCVGIENSRGHGAQHREFPAVCERQGGLPGQRPALDPRHRVAARTSRRRRARRHDREDSDPSERHQRQNPSRVRVHRRCRLPRSGCRHARSRLDVEESTIIEWKSRALTTMAAARKPRPLARPVKPRYEKADEPDGDDRGDSSDVAAMSEGHARAASVLQILELLCSDGTITEEERDTHRALLLQNLGE